MTLNEIGFKTRVTSQRKGFDLVFDTDFEDRPDFVASKLALIHSEVSEALEALRDCNYPLFAEELADVVIRLTSLSVGCNVDLDLEVERKLATNESRTHKHGGKRL